MGRACNLKFILFFSLLFIISLYGFSNEPQKGIDMSTISPQSLTVSDAQFQQAQAKLGELVAMKSVSNSSSPDYSVDTLRKTAEAIGADFDQLGFDIHLVSIEDSAPYIIAKKVVDAALPTIVLYAHYDVQPVDSKEWKSDPFVMEKRDGRLYGRGASDDKAGIVAILTAIKVYEDAGVSLPVNVTFFSEGEEEIGSAHMPQLLKQKAQKLDGAAMVVLDAMNRDVHTGTLTSSTRGVIGIGMKVTALEQPVHSGIGCLAPDPAGALVKIVAKVLDDPRKVPGLMDGITPLPDADRALLAKGSVSDASYKASVKALPGTSLRGDLTTSVYERIEETPSVSILNINSGTWGGGNSIQAEATCSIGIRPLVGQDPDEVSRQMQGYLVEQGSKSGCLVEVSSLHDSAHAWKANLLGPFSKAYMTALNDHFPDSAVMPCGGALPLLREFETTFPHMEIIGPGVEDPDTNAHSHNESQSISVFRNSINALVAFLESAAKIRQGDESSDYSKSD